MRAELLPAPFSLLPAPRSLLPGPCSLLPGPCSPLSALRSLLPAPCSLLPAPRSLLPAPCSLLPAPCSLLSAPCSLLPALRSLLPAPCSPLPTRSGESLAESGHISSLSRFFSHFTHLMVICELATRSYLGDENCGKTTILHSTESCSLWRKTGQIWPRFWPNLAISGQVWPHPATFPLFSPVR